MSLKTIKKTIDIKAPKEKVWEVLTEDKYTRQWYSAFSKGAHAVTDWKVGNRAVFLDDSQTGLISRVIENKKAELLSMEFEGMVLNGKEDLTSEDARSIKGGKETYRLSEKNGLTTLSVAGDMDEKMFDMMSKQWDAALQKFKTLAEK